MDPREIVRECPWSHAVDGPCTNYVATYQMGDYRKRPAGRAQGCGGRCGRCGQWVAPPGVAATHDRLGRPIEIATRGLTSAEKRAQGERCGCGGADEYCPCQNSPDAETVAARLIGQIQVAE